MEQTHVLRIKYPKEELDNVVDFLESITSIKPNFKIDKESDFVEINLESDEVEKVYNLVEYINGHRYEPAEQFKEVEGAEIYMEVKSNDLHLTNKVLECNNRFLQDQITGLEYVIMSQIEAIETLTDKVQSLYDYIKATGVDVRDAKVNFLIERLKDLGFVEESESEQIEKLENAVKIH